ncbi:MAG: LysR family transcriptional regulator, partial [Pseudomonadota bacterium]
MDIELARTYLAVMQHGSFKHAATSLHCTQSTVTARIQHLEQLLGRPLFTRSRAGATATAEGRRFRPYAERLMFSWREAQQALGLPSHLLGSLRVALDRRLAHTLGPVLSQR